MKIDKSYLEGFTRECIRAGLDDDQIQDAYVINCGKEALADTSFSKGFHETIKNACVDLSELKKTDLHRFIGSVLLSGLMEKE